MTSAVPLTSRLLLRRAGGVAAAPTTRATLLPSSVAFSPCNCSPFSTSARASHPETSPSAAEKSPGHSVSGRGPYTRPVPRAPYGVRERQHFAVNEDPEVLDKAFELLLGDLSKGLPDELKWQAVTHKSFDHGRQPNNEKLAFFGRRFAFLENSLSLLNAPPAQIDTTPIPNTEEEESGKYAPVTPFVSEDYKNLHSVSYDNIGARMDSTKLAMLARRTNITGCMRWKPARINDLVNSGQNDLAVDCIYAIIGALSLQRGNIEASKATARIFGAL